MKEKTAKPSVVKEKKEKKFSGPLAKPIVYLGPVPDPDFALTRSVAKKLTLLFEHYGLEEPPHDKWVLQDYEWAALVLRMAMDLVPGFKIVDHPPPRPGQPKRPMLEDIELLAEVWRLKEKQPGLTVSAAAKILVSKPKSRWFGKPKRTLEKNVGKALRSREIRDYLESIGAFDQTEPSPKLDE